MQVHISNLWRPQAGAGSLAWTATSRDREMGDAVPLFQG